MSFRKDVALLVAVAAAGAALVVWLIVRSGVGGGSPLAAVPEGSFLVATVDVRAIAASPLVETILGKEDTARALGVDALTESCGFNPLTRLRGIALAVPEEGEGGDFGVVATGDMTRDELTRCAQAMITRRGGSPRASTLGGFTVVEDARADAAPEGGDARGGPPKVAFRDGGPYLVGRGAWLARMVDVAEGRAPSVEKSAAHRALRAALDDVDPQARALVVTAVLPKALRDRLRREVEADRDGAEPSGGRGAPNPMMPRSMMPNPMMEGVLGVSSVGVALRAGAKGEETWLHAELRCETPADCAAVEKLLLKKRLAWSQDFGVRLAGLGPLLDNLRTTQTTGPDGATLVVATHAPSDALASALDGALRRAKRPPLPSPPSAAPDAPRSEPAASPAASASGAPPIDAAAPSAAGARATAPVEKAPEERARETVRAPRPDGGASRK